MIGFAVGGIALVIFLVVAGFYILSASVSFGKWGGGKNGERRSLVELRNSNDV